MTNAKILLLTTLTVPATGLALGCYAGPEAIDGLDARVPAEISHAELLGNAMPPPPPDAESEYYTADEDDPSAIYGGSPVNVCGYPSTVELGGACTGTLVHPQLVIYAAHCGASYSKIYFGENYQQPARTVTPQSCKVFAGGGPGNGNDFAYCKLSSPVTNVPITPILMGCETQVLQPGKSVTLVGFGNADNGPYGIKRHVTTTINGIDANNEISIGGNGKDTCQGDSGGPAYVQLADGTWRVFGITSYGGACGTGGMYSMMHKGMSWFETQSGLDLTPCHNADGTWNPTAACGNFPTNPGAGGGSWAAGCPTGGTSGALSATCGSPYGGGNPNPNPDPNPNPNPNPSPPCTNCTPYTGSLAGADDYDNHPNGTWYQSTKSGKHEGWLIGPANTDFDLYLYKWQNNAWTLVAKSEGPTSTETISYSGTAGYYIWDVVSFSGAGNYTLYLKRP
jgi:hypothetical protein